MAHKESKLINDKISFINYAHTYFVKKKKHCCFLYLRILNYHYTYVVIIIFNYFQGYFYLLCYKSFYF